MHQQKLAPKIAAEIASLNATLEIRLGTRQLPTQMPRQVTIFHSLPRQKNAEAIPPVVPYKLVNYSVCSFFLLKFTNYSVRFLYHFFARIVVIDVG
jgi:hypothetical protein